MSGLVRRVTVAQASLALILALLSAVLLLDQAEVRLSAALHVAAATYDKGVPPEGCDRESPVALGGDLRSFDPRKGGYSRKEAKALLCLMHANGFRAAKEYLENRYYWDMLFPIVYGPALAAVFLFLMGASGMRSPLALALLLLPLGGAGLDIAENFAVRQLIETGPIASVDLLDHASLLTAAKYALVAPAFAIGLVGMLIVLARRSLAGGD